MDIQFSFGYTNELDETRLINQGYAEYLGFLADICKSEDDFIAHAYTQHLKMLVGDWQKYHSQGREGKYILEQMLKHIAKIDGDPKSWRDFVPTELVEEYHRKRIAMITNGLSNGIPIPEFILTQYPDVLTKFRQNPDWSRDIVTQSMISQFQNEDYSLLDSYGVVLRRQDGEVVTDLERNQIRTGLDEIFQFFPYLPELLRITKLHIVHTCGQRISGSPNAVGCYSNVLHTMILGVADDEGKPSVRSMAHELIGHWLDYASVPSQADLEDLLEAGADVVFRHNYNMSFVDVQNQSQDSILAKVAHNMTPFDFNGTEMIHCMRPSEIYARIAEQFISNRLFQRGNFKPVSVHPAIEYADGQGYWNANLWSEWLYQCAFTQIESRLELAQNVLQTNTDAPLFVGLQFGVFPWLEKISAISPFTAD